MDALIESIDRNGIEEDLKRVFLDQYERLQGKSRDIDLAAVPWLCSDDHVKKSIDRDGLKLLSYAQPAHAREILAQWKSQRGVQKRGWGFLKSYLDRVFPGNYEIKQLYLDARYTYPTPAEDVELGYTWWLRQVNDPAVFIDGTWKLNTKEQDADASRLARRDVNANAFLSSRLRVTVGLEGAQFSVNGLRKIMASILPARIVPEFEFWAGETIRANWTVEGSVHLDKAIWAGYPWSDYVVTDNPVRQFRVSNPTSVRLVSGLVDVDIEKD